MSRSGRSTRRRRRRSPLKRPSTRVVWPRRDDTMERSRVFRRSSRVSACSLFVCPFLRCVCTRSYTYYGCTTFMLLIMISPVCAAIPGIFSFNSTCGHCSRCSGDASPENCSLLPCNCGHCDETIVQPSVKRFVATPHYGDSKRLQKFY